MARDDEEALLAEPVLLFAFRRLVGRYGEATLKERLAQNLGRPSALNKDGPVDALLARASERVLDRIEIDVNAPAWVYVWRSNIDGADPISISVAPWAELPVLAFSLTPPADEFLARRDAGALWDEAIAEVCDAASDGSCDVFGRIGTPTGNYRRLDRDLIANLTLESGTNNASINGEAVYSIRVREKPACGRPSDAPRSVMIAAIRELWPDLRVAPPRKVIMRELMAKRGIKPSPSTLGRALKDIRSGDA